MLHTKFQASESSGSEEGNFLIACYVFLCVKPGSSWRRTILTMGPSFEQFGEGPLGYTLNFRHLGQMLLKKICLNIYVYYWFKPRTPWGLAILKPETFI